MDAVPKGKESDFTLPAVQAVLYCNKLFEFERRYREKGHNYKKRYERRLKDEKPVLEAFLSWLDAQKHSNSSKWNTALTYARNRKEDLMTYLEDGRCSLSNNLSENSIRPITVGRKNWLFCNSQDGAYATVAMKMFKTFVVLKSRVKCSSMSGSQCENSIFLITTPLY